MCARAWNGLQHEIRRVKSGKHSPGTSWAEHSREYSKGVADRKKEGGKVEPVRKQQRADGIRDVDVQPDDLPPRSKSESWESAAAFLRSSRPLRAYIAA